MPSPKINPPSPSPGPSNTQPSPSVKAGDDNGPTPPDPPKWTPGNIKRRSIDFFAAPRHARDDPKSPPSSRWAPGHIKQRSTDPLSRPYRAIEGVLAVKVRFHVLLGSAADMPDLGAIFWILWEWLCAGTPAGPTPKDRKSAARFFRTLMLEEEGTQDELCVCVQRFGWGAVPHSRRGAAWAEVADELLVVVDTAVQELGRRPVAFSEDGWEWGGDAPGWFPGVSELRVSMSFWIQGGFLRVMDRGTRRSS